MKKTMMSAIVLTVGANAFAGNLAVEKAAAKLKANDTRTIVKEVENIDDNPCMPKGKSYRVDLQVKQAAYDYMKSKVVYSWETVKTIGVDQSGSVMEVCAE